MSEQIKFVWEKETKNTVKFSEQPAAGKPPVVGTLYVQKWFAGSSRHMLVTITPEVNDLEK